MHHAKSLKYSKLLQQSFSELSNLWQRKDQKKNPTVILFPEKQLSWENVHKESDMSTF